MIDEGVLDKPQLKFKKTKGDARDGSVCKLLAAKA